MMRSSILIVVLSFAAAVTTPETAFCADAAKDVSWREAVGPFGSLTVEDVWMQRNVVVENRGRNARQVKVGFVSESAQRGQDYFTRVLTLPAMTRRVVELAVRAGEMKKLTAGKASSSALYEQKYVVWDAASDQIIDRNYSQVQQSPAGTTVVGVVLDPAFAYERFVYLRELPDQPLGAVRVVGTQPDLLPSRWHGYSMVRMMIVGGLKVGDLRPAQREALIDWVRRGGVLLLAGTADRPGLMEDLGPEAGVAVVGRHWVAELDAPMRSEPVKLVAPLPMAELAVGDARVLYHSRRLPLLTARGLGQGTVLTLAVPVSGLEDKAFGPVWEQVRRVIDTRPPVCDDAFVRPEPQAAQFRQIAQQAAQRVGALSGSDREACRQLASELGELAQPGRFALQSIAGRRGPGVAVPLAILLGLAGLVGAAGLGLRLVRRGELLWMVLVPASLALSAGLYVAGAAQADPERLSVVGVVTSLEGGRTRVQQMCGYYSGPDARTIDLTSGDARGTIRDVGSASSGALGGSQTRNGAMMSLPDQKMPPNSTRAFYLDSVGPAPAGLDARLTFGGAGLAGTVGNRLGGPLNNCVIYSGRRTYRVGVLPAGDSAVAVGAAQRLGRITFQDLTEPLRVYKAYMATGMGGASSESVPLVRTAGEFTAAAVKTQTDVLRNQLLEMLAAAPAMGMPVDDRPLLVGYLDGGLLDPLGGREVVRQGWSVVVWPLTFEAPAAGTPVFIPSGLGVIRLGGKGSALFNAQTERFSPLLGGATLSVRVAPPSPLRITQARAKLTVRATAANCRMVVSGIAGGVPDGAMVKLGEFESPNGRVEMEIDSLDRFANADGEFALWLRFEALPQAAGRPGGEANRFESVDVDLEGICR